MVRRLLRCGNKSKNDYEKEGSKGNRRADAPLLPLYMEDLQRGAYTVPAHTEQSLRHIFTMELRRSISMRRCRACTTRWDWAQSHAAGLQGTEPADSGFLNYLALRHDKPFRNRRRGKKTS